MKIIGAIPLYLVYKGLTTGAGSLVAPVPKTVAQIEQLRKDEVAIEKQKEEDKRKKVEEEKKAEDEAQKLWQTIENKILSGEGRLTCKYGFREKLIRGSYEPNRRHSYWTCEEIKGLGI